MTVQRIRGISGRIMKRGNLLREKQNVWLVLIMKENKTCIGHLCVSDFSMGETSPRERDFRERQRQTETETETETDRDRERQMMMMMMMMMKLYLNTVFTSVKILLYRKAVR